VKRCVLCVLPDHFPGISFDKRGVCSLCLSHKGVSPLGDQKLGELFSANRGDTYDCLVPISGGRDSCYTLYKISKNFGCNVLAFHYDNGFVHPNAKKKYNRNNKKT
jgi:glucosamine--fructose-6-phosphate aminotransferase (isomerizing)